MAVDYQDAVQALKDSLGTRWDGAEDEGRSELARTVQERLGCSASEARDAVDAMIASGTLRYQRDGSAERAAGDADGIDTPPIAATPVASGLGNTPIPAVNLTSGYWHIGGDSGSSEASGRKGQVDPT